MKKLILIILLISWQFNYAQDIYIGAKAGLNLSNFIVEETSPFNQRTSWHAGITAELSFSDILSIQAEALYSNQGALKEDVVNPADYISVPIIVKVYPTEFFSFDLGGQFSYLIDDQGELTEPLGLKESDIGLVVGLTLKTKVDLYFQARYVMGLVEFETIGDLETGDIKNQVFQFSIGYNFL